jgi:hypothetical protein
MSTDPVVPSPPFEESEAEGSLRRIAECARERNQRADAMAKAHAAYKAAKEAYEEACEEERQTIAAETEELPLFPRPRPTPPAEGNGASPSAAPGDGTRPDPDASTWLSGLERFPSAALAPLGVAGLQTVADLRAFLADGGDLAALEGMDAKLAAKVVASLERFDDSRGFDPGTV